MMEQLVLHSAEQRVQAGPLGPHLDGFAALLREQGYANWTVQYRVRVVTQLGQWLERNRGVVDDRNEQTIVRFLRGHGRRGGVRHGDVAALDQCLSGLRANGVIRSPVLVVVRSERARIEAGYVQYLSQERALQAVTQQNYLGLVRGFLDARFGRRRADWSRLTSPDIADFLRRYAGTARCVRAKLMVTALRSFFRFLHVQGHVATNLAVAVPAVAGWRLAGIPRSLESHQVERLLHGCDRTTAVGRRDHALLLVLARLGLRAGEIVRMTLEDIDWEAGVLTVRGKGAREDRLPIPGDVGQALASYLRQARPRCTTRRVFVRTRAPLCGFANSVAVSTIVRRALERVGIESPCKGAHLLRHSLATRMLGRNASLAEIGEVLRHRSPNTTQIYTKVDLLALRALAMPWPGGVR